MRNIEEDIKILTYLIEINRHRFASRRVMTIYIEDIRAIDHILQEREQDKARIKELEEERQLVGMPVRNKRSGKIGIVLHLKLRKTLKSTFMALKDII